MSRAIVLSFLSYFSFNLLHTFLVLKLFTTLETNIGYYGVFWIYAANCFIGSAFVYLFLPETKGKTLVEIEKLFARSWNFTSRNLHVSWIVTDASYRVHTNSLDWLGHNLFDSIYFFSKSWLDRFLNFCHRVKETDLIFLTFFDLGYCLYT